MNDKARIAYLAWRLEMKLDAHRIVSEKEEPETFITTYRKGAKSVVDDTHVLAKEILEIANRLNQQQYMIEDVDLSGNEHIGQRIDKYA
ncbi:hypothetical protein [Cytobacillus oceanisediminis]|uniref:hypothetical protein n=1 Tax=Cytobacillus oceanisediminis TaxID=665099 RepID=UPI003736A3E5